MKTAPLLLVIASLTALVCSCSGDGIYTPIGTTNPPDAGQDAIEVGDEDDASVVIADDDKNLDSGTD